MVAGLWLARRIAAAPALAAHVVAEVKPGRAVESDAELLECGQLPKGAL